MKINEKNMCYLASSTPNDLDGWLQKRGDVNKSWQRRYFVLKGNLLFYFEKKGDREPIGVIILEGCSIELADRGENYSFQIVFHGINNRTYFLCAETQEIMEQWMKALSCAGYEYMKSMVAELERQLVEIKNSDSVNHRAADQPPRPPPRAHNTRENPFNKPTFSRTAPPPPVYANPSDLGFSKASNGGGMVSPAQHPNVNHAPGGVPFNLTASGESNQKSKKEFNFQILHEMFGKEIEQDYRERQRLKELSDQPLIDL